MTDVVVDRLRLRGAGARRLATVAARALPGALEDALADLADGALGPLSVTLDLDPTDYDDATLALLWADRIRAAALAAGARRRRPPDGAEDPGTRAAHATDLRTEGGPEASGAVDAIAATLAAWLDADAPRSAVPLAVARLADRAVAADVVARLGAARAARLAAALRPVATRARPGAGGGPAAPPTRPPAAGAPVAPPRPTTHDVAPGVRPGRHSAAPDDPTGDAVRSAAALRTHLALAADEGPASTADLDLATRAAGIVLCYPWLADLCRDAEARHPRADPRHARRLALATLAAGWLLDTSPAGGALVDPALLDDPLVLLLAGAGDDPTPGATLAPLDATDLAAQADDVLARFAGLLRGFERSTPTFVRASWVQRAGLLDLDRDPARLVAQSLPLDVVLGQLPYPVTLLRLPWSPPLTVRFAP